MNNRKQIGMDTHQRYTRYNHRGVDPSGICFDYAAFLRRARVGTSMTTG
jgi:hypothetical protein